MIVQQELGPLGVATLLVSASCGIGFLFGSGEMALREGMAGSLYPLATAGGMVVLAFLARPLWLRGQPIWGTFGRAYGAKVGNGIAVLSLIWMTGVLAAQIKGGVAIATLCGLPHGVALAVILALVLTATSLRLGVAATIFAGCLLASNLVLLYVVIHSNGLGIYTNAIPKLARDTRKLPPFDVVTTVVAVTFLVVTGADYQQFIIAARRPRDAYLGTILAAVILFATGFLPASAVLANQASLRGAGTTDTAQVIPFLLSQSAAPGGHNAEFAMLAILLAAALGSAAAVTRAMVDALSAVAGSPSLLRRPIGSIVILGTGGTVAAANHPMVETIVSMNIAYVASVGALFIQHEVEAPISPRSAWSMGIAGLSTSMGLQMVRWFDLVTLPSVTPLVAGLSASVVTGVVSELIRLRPIQLK